MKYLENKSLHGWFMEEIKLFREKESMSLNSQSKALPCPLSPETCTNPS